jgi:glycosyltransferase involved in cell wall biosynthesis
MTTPAKPSPRVPVKLVMVVTGLGVGGAERQIVALAHRFQALGSSIVVVTLIEPGPLKEELTKVQIPVYSLGMKRGIPGPGAIWRLAKIVRREKPEIVHAHMFHANILARVSRLLWRHIPLVCAIRNVNEVSSRSTNWNDKTWRDDAYRFTNFLTQKTTAVCDTCARRYIEIGAFRPDQIVSIPNGIVVAKFARDTESGARLRTELGLEGKIVGLMVSRMEPPKDHALLLRAWAAALQKNSQLHLVFVGDGPDRGELEKLAASLNITAHVSFMGIRKDVRPFLSMADFFLLITIMEGMPVSVLEAAAASLPAIASSAGGIPEVINDGKTGFLVPPGDLARLIEAIGTMASLPPAERAAMGAAARELISTRYDFELMTQSYLEVYNHAMTAVGKSGPINLSQTAIQPKRVLMVITGLGVGGAEWQLAGLAQQLRPRGISIVVVTLIEPGPLKDELAKLEIPVYSLGMKRGVPGLGAPWRLAKLIRREKPDVVHAHMFHANILARVSRLWWRKIPLVCTIQNVNEASSRSAKWNEKTWRDHAYRFTNFLSSRTTAVCDTAVQRYIDVRTFHPNELEMVPNAIPVSKFARNPEAGARLRKELGLEAKIIGVMVARMEPPKDHALLLRAWAGALRINPDLHLLFVGDGPARAALEELAASLNITGYVTFLGIRTDVNAVLSAADFFLLITNMEGLPLVILEAAAAGLPAIASRAGGIPEAVCDGKTGFLVRPGDLAHLTQTIEKIASLPAATRAAMGVAAHQLVAARFDFDIVVGRWLEIYSHVMRDCSA